MLTQAGDPATSLENLEMNTSWDGFFHAITLRLRRGGLLVLWRAFGSAGKPG
jgi:uncharacterized membrane protein